MIRHLLALTLCGLAALFVGGTTVKRGPGSGGSIWADTYVIELRDFDADGDIDGVDLQAAYDDCDARSLSGAGTGGCVIEAPSQTINIATTIELGSSVSAFFADSITLRGQGACNQNIVPRAITGGTAFTWTGAEGGTMFRLNRTRRLNFIDFCVVTDSDMIAGGDTDVSPNGSSGAGIVFEFPGAVAGATQSSHFDRLAIFGPTWGDYGAISAIADNGGGFARLTVGAHDVAVGDAIAVYDTTNYRDIYTVTAIGATTVDINRACACPNETGNYIIYADVDSTAFHISGTGAPKSSQNDKIIVEDIAIERLDYVLILDALQAVANVFYGGQLRGNSGVFKWSAGSFDLRDLATWCDGPGCVMFEGVNQTSAGQQETLISNVYTEMEDSHTGVWGTFNAGPETYLRMGTGYSPANPPTGSKIGFAPIVFENGYINAHDITHKLIDATLSSTVVFRGYEFTTSDGSGRLTIEASNPNSANRARLVFSENQVRPSVESSFFSTVSINPGTTSGAPNLVMENFRRDFASGKLYNDLDWDGVKDSNEGTTFTRYQYGGADSHALWVAGPGQRCVPNLAGAFSTVPGGIACGVVANNKYRQGGYIFTGPGWVTDITCVHHLDCSGTGCNTGDNLVLNAQFTDASGVSQNTANITVPLDVAVGTITTATINEGFERSGAQTMFLRVASGTDTSTAATNVQLACSIGVIEP